MKCTASTLAVTQMLPACRSATTAQVRSICAMIMPPKTVSLAFRSLGNTM